MFQVSENADGLLIQVGDDLTIFNITKAHEALMAADWTLARVNFDLADVQDIDTTGIQLLLSLEKTLKMRSVTLELVNPQESVLNTMQLMNISHHFGLQEEGRSDAGTD
jgi:anti-anti-sigma factor